jgi:RNA polymerase sigma factor (sigma-70 family)
MFTSYLKKSLKETRKNYYSREKKYLSNIRLTDFSNILTYQINIEDMCIDITDKFESVELYNSFNLLSTKQRDVIIKYYIYDKNEVEISKNMGISKQAVNRIRKRALLAMSKITGKGLT